VEGLGRLRSRYLIGTLSNGNISLLANLARNAGLPWDYILSAEMARHYKPDPEVYHAAVQILGLAACEVMMVAAHRNDLEAAKDAGMKTAFVSRPLEHGPEGKAEVAPAHALVAADFLDLAQKLGA
jgi:2-haloacid dehalogenase